MDLRILVEPHQGATYAEILRAALVSEAAGFDGFFRSDHLLAMDGTDGWPGPSDAWTSLAGLARDTSTVRLGTLVSPVTFRPPSLLAIQVAQVDDMSDGRVELGLGAGWFAAEHSALGLPFPGVKTRFDLLTEQCAIITGMWLTPRSESFSFHGANYSLVECPGLPKPRQSPLPVIIGGTGRGRTPRLAARYASEFNAPFVSVAVAADLNAAATHACSEIGREPGTLVRSVAQSVACGRTPREVDALAVAAGSSPERFRAKHIAGTPGEVAQQVATYAEVGYTRMYLQLPDLNDIEHIELIAAEVAPLLTASPPLARQSTNEGGAT